MDLIYAEVVNNEIVDKGIIANFNLDLSFGENENDFVLKCPEGTTRLYSNMVIYIDGTEYGGVIDSVSIDTETRMFTYSGRTWHGILENKVVYPYRNADRMVLTGEANYVLGILLERMSLIPSTRNEQYVQPEGAFIKASTEDSGIYIDSYVVTNGTGTYCTGYSLIRDMLYQYKAKPIIINGVIKAVNLADYTMESAWLYDSQQFTAKTNYNSINHLHCMGQGELSNRYTIDIYLNSSGVVLPYGHDSLIYDSDYYTDIKALEGSTDPEEIEDLQIISNGMITGVNEICDVYDYPNAQTVYHYVLQTEQPSDWDTENSDGTIGFEKYYVLDAEKTDENEAQYELLTPPDTDIRYELLTSQPTDWATNYTAYYEVTESGYENVETGQYTLLDAEPGDWATSYDDYFYKNGENYYNVKTYTDYRYLTSRPSAWDTQYMLYFMPDGSGVEGVTPTQTYTLYQGGQPNDWATSYSNYYYYNSFDGYHAVSGVSQTGYGVVYEKPGDWAVNWGNYYIDGKNGKVSLGSWWPFPSKGAEALWSYLHRYNITIYYQYTYTIAPSFSAYYPLYTKDVMGKVAPTWAANTYCYKYQGAPTWEANTYYKYADIPTWVRDTYYKGIEYQPVLAWQSGTFYTQVEDHYQSLVQGALNKLSEMQSKSELAISIAEGGTEYDINDVVAASDEVTGLAASAKVNQKILKIDRGIPSVSYKVGNI